MSERRRAMGADPLAGLDAARLTALLGGSAKPAAGGEPAPQESLAEPPAATAAAQAAVDERSDASALARTPDRALDSIGPRLVGPSTADEALSRARHALATGDVREARAAFEQTLEFDPENREALLGLADLHSARGDHRAAAGLLAQVHEAFADDVAVAIRLGRTYGRLTAYPEAEAALDRALRLEPQNAEARCELGIVLVKRGLYESAIEELRKALDHDPGLARAQYHLGVCYNQLDRLDSAAGAFERAVAMNPRDDRAHYHLGIVYDRKGMTEQARAMYRRAREIAEAHARRG